MGRRCMVVLDGSGLLEMRVATFRNDGAWPGIYMLETSDSLAPCAVCTVARSSQRPAHLLARPIVNISNPVVGSLSHVSPQFLHMFEVISSSESPSLATFSF
jgi:hypothetical protein